MVAAAIAAEWFALAASAFALLQLVTFTKIKNIIPAIFNAHEIKNYCEQLNLRFRTDPALNRPPSPLTLFMA